MPKATIAARIAGPRRRSATPECRSRCPTRSEYPQRLSAVLSVIYLIYNEGYSASSGQRWIRDELCTEALRLGRVLAALVPDEAEVHGLVALMEFQSSRFAARTDADGRPILLEDQDRTQVGPGPDRARRSPRWSVPRRRCGARASAGVPTPCRRRSPSAMPSHRPPPTPTGRASCRSTTALLQIAPSPVVELNRAVAVAMADPDRTVAPADRRRDRRTRRFLSAAQRAR